MSDSELLCEVEALECEHCLGVDDCEYLWGEMSNSELLHDVEETEQ